MNQLSSGSHSDAVPGTDNAVSYIEPSLGTDPETDSLRMETPQKFSIFKPRLSKPNFLLAVLVNAVRMIFILVILCGLAVCGAVIGIAKGYMETAPSLDLALLSEQDKTSFLYDASGQIISDYKGTENRVMINIAMMPEHLRDAFVAVEDARFYLHNGVDFKRIVGSFVTNFLSGSQQGGSTITQQLIKNTVLSSELSYKRKIQEAYLAMQLETRYTKAQILECYLNTIYLGENYYGVQVASQGFFGKNPGELSLRECAMLAGLTSNPYYFNPRRNFFIRQSDVTDYSAITNNRTDYVLRCMYEGQFITASEYQEALQPSTAHVLEKSSVEGDGMYPYAHYVEYAVQDVIRCFLRLRNLEDTSENRYLMENELRTGGYYVKLAIDTQIQSTVEDTLEKWTKYPTLRDPSDKIYRTRNSDGTYDEIEQPQAAAVVLDYHTGELKAIVGSRFRPSQRKTLNRATDMKMPIGSTIKPIAVYAPALELGNSPASVVYNIPVPITGWTGSDGKDTWPTNYGGGGYVGPETLREAMKRSHNVGAAQALLNMVGVDRSADFLMRMGIDRDHIDATPFGLSLGSSGITPLQLAVAYGVLGNGGVYQEPISFLGISDGGGNVVWDSHANQASRVVFKPSTAWMTIDMMKDVVSGGTATAAKLNGQTVAGKTGTNSDNRGVTFCGMTGWYVSALWIGHDNYKPLSSKTTGSSGAIPLWKSYMEKIHSGLENKDIINANPAELGLVKVNTCGVSGQLATEACYHDSMGYEVVTDYWLRGTEPTVSCQMHRFVEVCELSGQRVTETCPRTLLGFVSIPSGHPLDKYMNDPQYSSVITEYLGAAEPQTICSIHQYGTQEQAGFDPYVQNSLILEAQQLIQHAYDIMLTLDMNSAAYQSIQNAAEGLRSVINTGSPGTPDVISSAMLNLTQAIAAAGQY